MFHLHLVNRPFTPSKPALPLLYHLYGCQNRIQHYQKPIKALNHLGPSYKLAEALKVLSGAMSIIEFRSNYSSLKFTWSFLFIDF